MVPLGCVLVSGVLVMPSRLSFLFAVLAAAAVVIAAPQSVNQAQAGGSSSSSPFYKPTKPKPKVRGSRQRVGGYSYSHQDSIIDFRDRSVFLDPAIDRPSLGPFDNDYFFDSGVERYNYSPYLN